MDLGELDLEAASKTCLAHGLLLALRYVVEVTPWQSIAADVQSAVNNQAAPDFRLLLHRLLALIEKVIRLTLPVLSLQEDAYIGKHLPYRVIELGRANSLLGAHDANKIVRIGGRSCLELLVAAETAFALRCLQLHSKKADQTCSVDTGS